MAAAQPFSLHTRGVTAYDSAQYLDLGHQLRALGAEVRDISSSAALLLYLQGWQSFWVTVVTIASVSFFNYVGQEGVAAALSWTPIAILVLLPLVLSVYAGFHRREEAHRELSAIKVLAMQIGWAFEGSPTHQPIVHGQLLSLLGMLKQYLNAQRFYSTTYPLGGITERMTVIAKARAKQMQQANLVFRNLSRCPEDTPQGRRQADLVLRLQLAFERLALLKEYRLPQGLRAAARAYVVLVIPIFYGPYYAEVSSGVQSFVFVLFFAITLHLAMANLLTASLALEDPFATDSLDGVFSDELLFEAEQVLGRDSLLAHLEGNGLHEGPGTEAPASPATLGRPGETELHVSPVQPMPSRELRSEAGA